MSWPDLKRIQGLLGDQALLTRFAPSPTGYLHMGHIVHALYVWGIAKALGGKVVLRMENHDRIRCKPAYETALLEDLEWLGLVPDFGTPSEFRAGACAYRQSDCEARYQQALARLRSQGLVYACDCSRKRILARTGQIDVEELPYDGYCRDRHLQDGAGMTLRLRLPSQTVVFEDILQGRQVQQPAIEIGDVAIRDNHGHWTYQFAVVNDDIRQGINLVVRGIDILSSTGRQIILAEHLGHTTRPIYLHHALLVDAAGRKLSKRDFDADIHTLYSSGMPASQVIGQAAWLAGWTDSVQEMDLNEIISLFQSNG